MDEIYIKLIGNAQKKNHISHKIISLTIFKWQSGNLQLNDHLNINTTYVTTHLLKHQTLTDFIHILTIIPNKYMDLQIIMNINKII